ncbi:MAG: hypothetical protein ABIE47_06625 [Pseudomonadota bacterium]
MQGPYTDQSKPFKKTTVCHECEKRFKKGEEKAVIEIYDDPFADKPRIVAVHTENDDGHGTCLDKLTDTSWADHRYMECPICERMVLMHNGWRPYFKAYGDDEICAKCYQDIVLEDGHGAKPFEAGKIPGDFFNSSDLSGHGWAQVPGFNGFFINGGDSAKRFCSQALKLIEEGHKVLVDYDSLGIGGGEGYVTMMVKEAAHG